VISSSARTEVSKAFRDALHDQYESINKSKKERQRAIQTSEMKMSRGHSLRKLNFHIALEDDLEDMEPQPVEDVDMEEAMFSRLKAFVGDTPKQPSRRRGRRPQGSES
jgi:hypothetical protein